jgi:hypothetical protein
MSQPRRRLGALAVALLLGAILSAPAQAKGGRGTVRLYKANGRYAGRIDPSGRFYGENGRYLGRVEGNRIYSAQGRYMGRFEESGVFHDVADMSAGGSRAGASRAEDPRNVASGPDGDHGSQSAVGDRGTQPAGNANTVVIAPVTPAPAAAGASPAGGAGRMQPPAVLSSDPSAGASLIEIVRPDKGTR